MSNQNISDLLIYEIYPALYHKIDQVLPEFGFKYKGRYWQSSNRQKIDGTTGDALGAVYVYENSPYGIKDFTRGFVSFWKYFQEKNNFSNRQTLEFLADAAGIKLPDINENPEKHKSQAEKAQLWEEIHWYFRNQLFENKTSDAENHRKYLKKIRGYNLSEVKFMEIGYFPSNDELMNHLIQEKKYDPVLVHEALQSFKKFEGNSQKNKYHLTTPFKNISGIITGFSVRTIDPNTEPRYLNTTGTEKGLFNFNATRLRKRDILLVEGQLDALHCSAKGFENTVALSGSSLSNDYIELFEKFEIKSVTLILDGDRAGKDATIRIINQYLNLSNPTFRLYIVEMPKDEDPDSFLLKFGADEFEKMIRVAKRHFQYLADQIMPPFQIIDTPKQIDFVIDESAKIAFSLNENLKNLFFQHLDSNSVTPEISFRSIEDRFLQLKIEKEKNNIQNELSSLLREAIGKNHKGIFIPEVDHFKSRLREITSKNPEYLIESYTAKKFIEDLKHTDDSLLTGFKILDDVMRIPQGAITLIAGRTGHGKTTVLLNLLWSMSTIYPGKSFYFFTFEEERKYLSLKLLNLIIDKSEINPNYHDNKAYLKSYISHDKNDDIQIEKAKIELFNRFENKQIQIMDKNFSIENLVEVISHLKNLHGDTLGGIFIDYIQKINSDKRFEIRQRQLQYISNILLQDVAKDLSVPLMIGAQLNRDTDKSADGRPKLYHLREAGDLEQDANVVLSVYNPLSREENETEIRSDRNEIAPVVPIELKTLKNRDGPANRTVNVLFNPSTGRIYDRKTDQIFDKNDYNNSMFN